MRTCPKCSDYYADDSLAFCLADGTPLTSVDANGERWNDGSQAIERKHEALTKQKRKLIWRWIVASAMTTLMFTLAIAGSFTVETTTAVTIPPVLLPTSTQECSEADRISALKTLRSLERGWRRQIQSEQATIINENVPSDFRSAEAGLEKVEFRYTFPQPCAAAVVTVTYTWQLSWPANPVTPAGSKNVSKERTFMCRKFRGRWNCPTAFL